MSAQAILVTMEQPVLMPLTNTLAIVLPVSKVCIVKQVNIGNMKLRFLQFLPDIIIR